MKERKKYDRGLQDNEALLFDSWKVNEDPMKERKKHTSRIIFISNQRTWRVGYGGEGKWFRVL